MSEEQETVVREIVKGMRGKQKSIPSRFLYDRRGSELFEKICEQEEYYIPSAEEAILDSIADELQDLFPPQTELIEFGSGSSRKTRILLDRIGVIRSYIPIDISNVFLSGSVEKLRQEYPGLDVRPVVADYRDPIHLPEPAGGRVVWFPGSSIGNFSPEETTLFLRRVAEISGESGGFLIGIDLKKEPRIIEAAYNDEQGTTALFNLNILLHLNKIAGADFNTDNFRHRAFYNDRKGRIEMHLVSRCDQQVQIEGQRFAIAEGESIHTENSWKFTPGEFLSLTEGRFELIREWTDEKGWFLVLYLEVSRQQQE